VLWWLGTPEQLDPAAHSAIEDPTNDAYVSAVSPWELAIKSTRHGLQMPEGFGEHLQELGLRPLAITWAHGIAAGALPLHHNDPFDRMLVAQARLEDLTIMTRDQKIAAYDVRTMRA
jgi:PIN domain nuclease of toxin-antitoxin system